MDLPKPLRSSDGSGKLSTTIKGILVAFVPLIVTYTSLEENVVMELIQAFTAVLSGLIVIYGIAKKVYNRRFFE